MLQETLEIEVLEVQALAVHGSPYYQVTYKRLPDGPIQQMRINPEAFYPDPQPGDRAEVNLVMGNIMGATKRD